ncbi:MAG: cob(I)yrinic acid a,c-diamide adenosyltransferase [Chitinophagales bacterium]
MKIYTKTGDKGETGLFGGSRVSKADLRVEAYGTVDELNSVLAVVIEHVGHNNPSAKRLINVQDYLFRIGSHLASLDNPTSEFLPELNPIEIERLEKDIDDLTNDLPPLKNFILPGGSLSNAYCHVARSVCRRAERRVVALDSSLDSVAFIIQYLNRLSDYLFVLSRQLAKEQGVGERKWEA